MSEKAQNVRLLTGADSFRLKQKLEFYKKGFEKKYDSGEIEFFEGTQSFKQLQGSILTKSLFSEKKIIIVQEFWNAENYEKAEKADFFTDLESLDPSVVLLLVEPSLDKRKKSSKTLLKVCVVETFEPLDEFQSIPWVMELALQNNGQISRELAQALIKRVGVEAWTLSQEVQKLIMGSEKGIITEDLMNALTQPHPQVVIWNFLEALSRKQLQPAMAQFRALTQGGESAYQLFAMISREVRIHTQILMGLHAGLNAKEIAGQAGIHPFVVQKTIPLTKNFTPKSLVLFYETLYGIDEAIKTGKFWLSTEDQSEFELALERLILKICTSN